MSSYELFNFHLWIKNQMHIFQCMGNIFCLEFQKLPFEIPHKISYPYIEGCVVCWEVKIEELPGFRAPTRVFETLPRSRINCIFLYLKALRDVSFLCRGPLRDGAIWMSAHASGFIRAST